MNDEPVLLTLFGRKTLTDTRSNETMLLAVETDTAAESTSF